MVNEGNFDLLNLTGAGSVTNNINNTNTNNVVQSNGQFSGQNNQFNQYNVQNTQNTQVNVNNNNKNNINLIDTSSLFENLSILTTNTVPTKSFVVIPKKLVLDENTAGANNCTTGLIIEGSVQREFNGMFLILSIFNKTSSTLFGFEIQLNTNYYGINCMSNSLSNIRINSLQTQEVKIDLFTNVSCDLKKLPNTEPYILQAAIRCNLDEFFFKIPVMFSVLFETDKPNLSMEDFISSWQLIQTRVDMSCTIDTLNQKYQSSNGVKNYTITKQLYKI